ncbi:MAG: exosortase Q [Azoarcus sp.]|jgi:exosortase/archaeosortase family protein|nr:exosortase Q [Azoarcus sp.]
MTLQRIDRLARQLDRFPPAVWLALLGAAMWPQLLWMARRMLDGSDDPLGIAALAALAFIGWRHRGHLRQAPRPAWFFGALLMMAMACATWHVLPPLFSTLLALLGFTAGMLALLPGGVACAPAPILGLAALSLPVMASLQFYAGYPLRLVAAEVSRWLLMPGYHVEREGVALRLDGQLVLVDAACSGVQLVWLGYFTACATALLTGCGNTRFLRHLPVVGALVLTGNVLRNAVLVALQADGKAVATWLHEGIGLLTLAVVCALIFQSIQGKRA